MERLHSDIIIRTLVESDYSDVEEITAGLPEWFDERAWVIAIPCVST
jgi:hypothetical protein